MSHALTIPNELDRTGLVWSSWHTPSWVPDRGTDLDLLSLPARFKLETFEMMCVSDSSSGSSSSWMVALDGLLELLTRGEPNNLVDSDDFRFVMGLCSKGTTEFIRTALCGGIC